MADFQKSGTANKVSPSGTDRVLRPRPARARQAGKITMGTPLLTAVARQLRNANASTSQRPVRHRSCGGRGAGVGAARAQSQRVIVKARIVRIGAAGGRGALAAHLHYIARHGVGHDGLESRPFDESGRLDDRDLRAFTDRAMDTRHQFRYIVSPENGAQMDLEQFTRELLAMMQTDLGTRLDYVAVAHHDTDNPHVHIVVNGRDDCGHDLVISRDYMSAGIRIRACDLATRELGLRSEHDIALSAQRDITAQRFTLIDRQLLQAANLAPDNVIDVRQVPASDDVHAGRARLTRLGRLNALERLRMAEEIAPGRWVLGDQFEERLHAVGRRDDIIKTLHAHGLGMDERVPVVILNKDATGTEPVTGKVVGKGLINELHDGKFVVIATTDGRVVYSALSRYAEAPGRECRPGDMVSLSVQQRSSGGAQRNIVRVARDNGGVYDPRRHLAHLAAREPSTARHKIDAKPFVAAHVKRLDTLARQGIVTDMGHGRFRVPVDLAERVSASHQFKSDAGAVATLTRHGTLSLERQVSARGLTWLDTALAAGLDQTLGTKPPRSAFQAELTDHLQRRRDFLAQAGLLTTTPGGLRVDAELAGRLLNLEQGDAIARLAPKWGTYVDVGRIGPFTGTLERVEDLPSGRYGLVHSGMTFTLAPVDTHTAAQMGRTVTVCVARDGPTNLTLQLAAPHRPGLVLLPQPELNKTLGMGLGLGMKR